MEVLRGDDQVRSLDHERSVAESAGTQLDDMEQHVREELFCREDTSSAFSFDDIFSVLNDFQKSVEPKDRPAAQKAKTILEEVYEADEVASMPGGRACATITSDILSRLIAEASFTLSGDMLTRRMSSGTGWNHTWFRLGHSRLSCPSSHSLYMRTIKPLLCLAELFRQGSRYKTL